MRAPFPLHLFACAVFACSREFFPQPVKPKPIAEEFIPDKVEKKHVEFTSTFALVAPYVPNPNYDFFFDIPTRYEKRRWSDSTFPNPQNHVRHSRTSKRKPGTKHRGR